MLHLHFKVAYMAPVDASSFSLLATIFILIGLFFVATFIVNELGLSHRHDSAFKLVFVQVSLGALASALLGVGTLFTLLASGIYV